MKTKDRNRDKLITNGIYHVFNRGINRQTVFHKHENYSYFLSLIDHCRNFSTPLSKHSTQANYYGEDNFRLGSNSKKPRRFLGRDVPVRIHAYCLMPNHFHLLLKQVSDGGISWFIQRVCDSYTKAYNKKAQRSGTLWEGKFKAKQVDDDYSYLQVIRYIHLNPIHSTRIKIRQLDKYPYSSYHEAIGKAHVWRICDHSFLRSLMSSPVKYRKFVETEEIGYQAQKALEDLIIEPTFTVPSGKPLLGCASQEWDNPAPMLRDCPLN